MNDIQVFNNPEFGDIRTVVIEDEPWWVGRDVAAALEYKNGSRDVNRHVDSEDRQIYRNGTSEINNRGVTIINESGLYSLILSSKLPSAKKFKRWITSEVLPELRRSGKYEIQKSEPVEQRQLTVDDYIRAASIIAGCRNERMPTVIALLKKSGIEIASLTDINSEYDETGITAALINRAINEYGMNATKIGRLCGLHATQIIRIRTGQAKPKKDRARIIQNAIQAEIDKLD